jgi:hypothetical protein
MIRCPALLITNLGDPVKHESNGEELQIKKIAGRSLGKRFQKEKAPRRVLFAALLAAIPPPPPPGPRFLRRGVNGRTKEIYGDKKRPLQATIHCRLEGLGNYEFLYVTQWCMAAKPFGGSV